MELRDYTEDEIEALVAEIGLGQMMRDAGASPMIPQYDVPRDAPSLRSGNTRLGDVAGQYMHPIAGEVASQGQRVLEQAPEFAYQASGLGLAEHGGESVSKGMNEGDYARVAGGAAEVGLAALPFSGRALGAAYKTIPRALGVGAAYGASPLVAAGVLSPEDAQASEGGFMDRLGGAAKDHGLEVAIPAAVSALVSGLTRGKVSRTGIRQKQEAVDLDRILANRERAEIVRDDFPIPNFRTKIDHELREIEPVKYHNKDNETLARMKSNLDDIGDANLKEVPMLGGLAGGVGAGVTDFAYNQEEFDPMRTLGATVMGALYGGRGHKPAKERFKTSIQRYDPNPDTKPFTPKGPTDQLRLGRSPISDAHPADLRTSVERRIGKGESIKELSGEYGLAPSTLYRWKKKLNKKSRIKPNKRND